MAQSKKPNSRVKTKPRIEFEEQPKKVKDLNKINDLDRPKPLKTAISNEDIAKGIKPARKNSKKVVEVTDRIVKLAMKGAEVIQEEKRLQAEAEATAKRERKALEKEMRTHDSLKELVRLINLTQRDIDKQDKVITTFNGFYCYANYVQMVDVLIQNPHSTEEEKEYYLDKAIIYAKYVCDFWLDLRDNHKLPKYNHYHTVVAKLLQDGNMTPQMHKELFLVCFDTMARQFNFKYFMIALEWNRPPAEQYFLPRMECFEHLETIEGEKVNLVQDVQDYIDGKIDVFMNVMGQRLGKTGLRIFAELLLMPKIGFTKAFFDLTYSTELSIHIYDEMIDIMTNKHKYRYFEIFRGHKLHSKSRDSHALNVDQHNSFSTFTSRSIEASITGTIEMSGMAGIDDIIGGVEEILNPETCKKIWTKFNTYILARMKKGVRLMATATLWGDNCPLTQFIAIIEEWVSKGALQADRVRIRRFAWCNSKGESQFDYKYNLGFDTAHFKRLEMSMGTADPALWQAMYMANPISREGRPLQNLQYYYDLPLAQPDRVGISIDTALGSKDFYAGAIGYIYEKEKKVFFPDVIYTRKDTDYSLPYTSEKIALHSCDICTVEEKEPPPKYASLRFGIGEKIYQLNLKNGVRCHIESKSASGEGKKRVRILSAKQVILATDSNDWKFYYLHPTLRQYNDEYNKFVENIQFWSEEERAQKKQQDGAPDVLAQFCHRILKMNPKKAEVYIGALPL